MRTTFLFLSALLSTLILASCGGGTAAPMLQSITISPQSGQSSTQFTAIGTYSNGKRVTPLPVSWVNPLVLTVALSTHPPYSLTTQSLVGQCGTSTGPMTFAAIAPADPNAPASGAMPVKVYQDLISGAARNEQGFVGATAQLNCP